MNLQKFDSPQVPALPATRMVIPPPRRLAMLVLFVVVPIIVVGTLANVAIYHVVSDPDGNLADVLRRFDLGHEPSIPNIFSAVIILVAAGLLLLIGHLEKQEGQSGSYYWKILAAIFLCLAIDEAVQFHEMANAAIGLFWETSGVLFLPWVIPGAICALVFATMFIPFVAGKSTRTLKIFIVAGGVFLAGAIGMEMISSLIFDQAGSEEGGVATLSHTFAQSIEEFCEMLGMVIFIYGLMDYLSTHFPAIELHLRKTGHAVASKES